MKCDSYFFRTNSFEQRQPLGEKVLPLDMNAKFFN